MQEVIKFWCLFFQAANQGAKFKGRILQISWYKPKTPSVSTEPDEEESKEEVNTAGIHVMTVITWQDCTWLKCLNDIISSVKQKMCDHVLVKSTCDGDSG